ncbi:MAG TPA: hypothetical protein VNE41_03615 [Chitinophagaceae bacterium]|nr:hypothetical protein [Chitinophagaceae bacterium]
MQTAKRTYFKLDPQEKMQERLMLAMAILAFLTLAFGIYEQTRHIKYYNRIFFPLFDLFWMAYLLFYSINALGKANLTPKWTPAYIFRTILFLTRRIGRLSESRSIQVTVKILGISGCIFASLLLLYSVAQITGRIPIGYPVRGF